MQPPTQTENNKRSAERFPVALPIQVGEKLGKTRDVSVSGVYFEIDEAFVPGSELLLSLDMRYAWPRRAVRLVCRGHVVRVERKDGSLGVAVTIDEHRFEET